MPKRSLRKKVGDESYLAEKRPDIMGGSICTCPLAEPKSWEIRVFVRPPGGPGTTANEGMYRVWHESQGDLRIIGRMYQNGKFFPLKTFHAREAAAREGWKKALTRMREAVVADALARKVMLG